MLTPTTRRSKPYSTRLPETIEARSSTTTLRIRTAIRSRRTFPLTRCVHTSLNLPSALTA
eukprot:2324981-Pleurochrysis_carterae.AAC.3